MTKETKCKVEGCENNVFQVGFCTKHYAQNYRHGKILKRTRYDSNEVINHKTYSEIIVYTGYSDPVEGARFKIDNCDVAKVTNYKWCIHDINSKTIHPYITTHVKGSNKKIPLRSVIIKGYVSGITRVRFINKDKLDYRSENLLIS